MFRTIIVRVADSPSMDARLQAAAWPGAFGHSRYRALVLGGVTRFLFEHAPVPVLFAH